MPRPATTPETVTIAPGLEVSRIITGLWQVADMERVGSTLDLDLAAAALADYARAGFSTFDMADHYGSAELIAGRCLELLAAEGRSRPVVMSKWVPEPGPMTPEIVRRAVMERLNRLGVPRIDLLQLHWWQYEHPGYLDAVRELETLKREGLIGHLGLTNFDTAHLRVLVKSGFSIATNQVCFSLLDRRAEGEMSAFCLANGVRLLAFGTLGGGFLSERWLGAPEPSAAEITDWSKMKYKRYIDAGGGWAPFQKLLGALVEVARRHGVSIANVATRWVLEHPAVAGVIIGARLGEREHRADNLRLFDFALDAADKAAIDDARSAMMAIPGDCGDEYRRVPFLTASGDLSHHLSTLPPVCRATAMPERAERRRVDTGSTWEPIAGYSRAVRVGNRILVSGTTATHGAGLVVCRDDPAGQAVYVLDKIAASIAALGGRLEDVVRTRIYVREKSMWEEVARAHGRVFGQIRPVNTLIVCSGLIGDYDVEIEAEAEVAS
jgi:aryl-alcohol dehydrogenase-like predicted oxidoreductase/enamine deaminase RidA (YjgF/YER057c/UK114 family)